MRKDIDWIQQMRTRLENHQEPVPDDLWDCITESLETKERDQQRKIISIYHWSRIAAAVLIFIIGGIGYYNLKYAEGTQMPNATLSQNKKLSDIDEQLLAITTRHSDGSASPMPTNATLATPKASVENSDLEEMADPVCNGDSVRTISTDVTSNRKEDQHQSEQTNNASQYKYTGATIATNNPGNSYSKKKISIGIHASNVFASQNSASNVTMSNALCASSFATSADNPALLAYYKETKHHFQPLSFGLTMSYDLTNRLSISTGVVYTMAISDFIRDVGEDEVKDCQRLTYVGIPVGLAYDLWKVGKLNVYSKVYGQMDFNVSATVEAEGVKSKIKKDRIQMSTGATIGAEYMIIPKLGFYVEPGIKYYFNNGSLVDNIYKEKPLNFNLQMGLRLTLNK